MMFLLLFLMLFPLKLKMSKLPSVKHYRRKCPVYQVLIGHGDLMSVLDTKY